MATQTPSSGPRPSFLRAFLPFWITLLLGSLVLMRDYHRRHAPLSRMQVRVTVEGERPDEGFWVDVGGRRQDPDDPVPIGFGRIAIQAPGTEAKIVRAFVWYGVTDLGSVDLPRRRGSIAARVVPEPDSYELKGKRGGWTNTTGTFGDIPVGQYELVSRFGSLEERTEVQVRANEMDRIPVVAKIGSLELSAEPAEGEFDLVGKTSEGRRSGAFPTNYPRLPAGPYRLVARRPGYERELAVEVRPNETNRFVVKFTYGGVEITTTPPGATVSWDGAEAGKAPLTLPRVAAGDHRMEAGLPGYDPFSVQVTVESEKTASVTVVLVNTRYREAMERARQHLAREEYAPAEEQLVAALAAQPGDATAAGLLPGTRSRALRARAEDWVRQGDFDAALKALDAALVAVPGDPVTLALQERIRGLKTQTAQERVESRFQQVVEDARKAAAQQDFKKALALMGEAKAISPSRPEVAVLEARFADEQLKKEINAFAHEYEAAWARALSGERDHEQFAEQTMNTSKPLEEVRAALERLGNGNRMYRLSELVPATQDIFTAKLGEIPSGFTGGHYIRIRVINHGAGDTRIMLKLIEYAGGRPETDRTLLRKHFDRFKAAFAVELGGDLK